MRTRTILAAAAIPVVTTCVVTAMAIAVAVTSTDTTLDATTTPCDTSTGKVWRLDKAQSAAARTVATVTATTVPRGDVAKATVIALATAWVESRIRPDLTEAQSDRDSAGMFQQRRPWGPLADRMNAVASTRMFLTGGQGGQPGLMDIHGWQGIPPGVAAQRVQVSAWPQRYNEALPIARAIASALTGTTRACTTQAPMGRCPASGSPAESGLTPDALKVIRCGHAQFPWITAWGGVGPRGNASDHPSGRGIDAMIPAWSTSAGRARGWTVARWYQSHARGLGITYVIFDARIWSAARTREGWRPYTNPQDPQNTRSNPTLLHRDHVHVSVHGNAGTNTWGAVA